LILGTEDRRGCQLWYSANSEYVCSEIRYWTDWRGFEEGMGKTLDISGSERYLLALLFSLSKLFYI